MTEAQARRDELGAEVARLRAIVGAGGLTYSEGEVALRAQAAEAQQLAKQMMDERDDARTQLSMLQAQHEQMCRSSEKGWAEVERLTAEVEMLRGVGCCESDKLNEPPSGPCGVCRKCAYRRGAEAMREACARWMSEREGISQWVYDDALSALPIPEEPTNG